MTNLFSLLSVLLLSISFSSFAQKPPIKFGKVSNEEMEMTHYELDSSASAVILCDYGRSYIDYGVDQFQVIHERTTRIKILTKDGYDYADHSFNLYKGNSSRKEVYSSLKGLTYNIENGSMTKTKLSKASVFKEEVDNKNDKISFTMPNVKVGSVIEYTYKITSDFLFNYQGWQFQYFIPVVWSEYNAKFIEYYNYKEDFQGYLTPVVNETTRGQQSFSIKVAASTSTAGGYRTDVRTQGYIQNYEASYTENRIVMQNIPAFVVEPKLTTKYDYISMINYELETINFPNRPVKRYRGTWESLNQELLENDDFGTKLKGSLFLNGTLKTMINENDTEEIKINKIHNYIINEVTWNKNNSKYSNENFKEVLENKKGSTADINLLLINMLIKAGINAEPVLLSTRSHGMVKEFNATTSQFNYVICKAWVGDSYVLIDATEKLLPIGTLPERCLNNRGYTISKTNPGWVELNSASKTDIKLSGNLVIKESGELTGSMKKMLDGYAGLYARKKYFYETEESYINNVIDKSNWELSNMVIENSNAIDKPFIESYDVNIESEADVLGNKIYLNPIIKKPFEENIYKSEERKYPVSYSSLFSFTYYVNFEIPEGYQLIEKPETSRMKLPDDSGSFTYSVSSMQNKISVLIKFDISKSMFLPNEYPYLKAFYAQSLSKMKEQIVLEKTL